MPIPSSPSALIASVLQRASTLQPLLGDLSIKHSLTTQQTGILVSAVETAQSDAIRKAAGSADTSVQMSCLPDETAIVVAFFGWDRHVTSSSTTSTPSTPGPSLSRISSGLATPVTSTSNRVMITCQLCQRQVGLWSFSATQNSSALSTPGAQKVQASRQFDVLKEHRPHCPFVVKTTYLPTISLPSKDPETSTTATELPFVEGWKALMSVVSRSQWRRAANGLNPFGGPLGSLPATPRSENDVSFEVAQDDITSDQVSEIVKDVKSRHGGVRTNSLYILALLT